MSTTARALSLLSLLQSRAVWSGPELAERLGVTVRSVRRDVDRLRSLGYPVDAMPGAGGGYRLAAGRAIPPLLLDDDEAVAVAVSLRLAATGSVTGAAEASLRASAKLEQVMPPRLRAEVRAVQQSIVTLPGTPDPVDADVLLTLALACRDRVRVRFGYADAHGAPTRRYVEPVQVVATGRRWYLMAWDLWREDWRSFRLDRATELVATTWRYEPRPHPDPADFVQRAVTAAPYRHVARVRLDAPPAVVAERVTPAMATLEDDGTGGCLLVAGGDDLVGMALWLLSLGHPVTVDEPDGLRAALCDLAARARGA